MSTVAGYAYVWEFRVAPERRAEFERLYGPDGDWVRLFRRGIGYVRTELHRDLADPGRYLTVDYWESEAAWATFRREHQADFAAVDARGETLTEAEREIGRFTPVR